MSIEDKIPVYQFASASFAELNADLFDKYISYRVHGYHSTVAFRRVFGVDNYDSNAHIKIDLVETNPYYEANYKVQMALTKVGDVWNTKISINELISIVRHPFAKDTARLQAVKELNVMCGITVVDDLGKTKAGRSLSDFYALQEDGNALPSAPEA